MKPRTRPIIVCLIALACASLGAAWKAPAEVSIEGLQFKPQRLTIESGQTVRWINNDDRDYRLVSRDANFESPNLKPGDRFEHTFERVGTFEYACAYKPRTRGTIVVE